ncbi:MAG: radical SAM protein [Candidatus Methanoperedens sp.]
MEKKINSKKLRGGKFKYVGKLSLYKIECLWYLLTKKGMKSARNCLEVFLFSRESGLGLLDPILSRFPALIPYPSMIEIEVTTRCNFKCVMCEHTYWNIQEKDMSFEEFKQIIDNFPKLKWVGLTGIGESFINKDYLDMLRYVKEKSIFVELFDSLMLVNEKKAKELVEMCVDKIIISMEGATKETYEKNRVGSNFDIVVRNIRNLIRIKKELKSPIPELWTHFIITKMNIHEMPAFVELIHSFGENEIKGIFFSKLLPFAEVKNIETDIPADIREATVEKAKELGIYASWNENVITDQPIKNCVRWTEPFIKVEGFVQPCCAMNEMGEEKRNYIVRNSFGNVFKENFQDIWNSEAYRNHRDMIHNNEVPEICRGCRVYMTYED